MDICSRLDKYIQYLDNPGRQSKLSFQTILTNGMDLLALNDEGGARFFDVSRPTVTRWRNGSTEPHRAMQKLIYNMLRKEASKQLRFHNRKKSAVVF